MPCKLFGRRAAAAPKTPCSTALFALLCLPFVLLSPLPAAGQDASQSKISVQTAGDAGALVQSVQVGRISVKAINDSPLVFDKSIFPAIDQHPQRLSYMPGGRLEALVKTYFVETAGRKVLFDGGRSHEMGGEARTPAALAAIGVKPEDVTDIFMTHLDEDHISGLAVGDKAVYPNAVLHIAAVEHDAWLHDMDREPAFIALAKRVLKAYAGRVQTFEYGDEAVPGIRPRAARGHTFGHTRYDIDSEGEGMTIVGDLIHVAPLQMRWPEYCTVYDAHPTMAARAREAVLAEAAARGRILAGMHIKEIGRIEKAPDGGYRFIGK